MKINYKDKKVLIFGLGVNQGGLGSARFFAKQGAKVKITDLKPAEELKVSLDQLKDFPDIIYRLGEHKEEDFDWADLVIRNQGVKPGNKYLEYAKKQGKQVEMDFGIFLQYVSPTQIIGITGSTGKSTTSSLIYEAIKDTFENSILAGNIGVSVLDSLEKIDSETKVVLEISSFQLEAFAEHNASPHIAVITNIVPDHLNYYPSMKEYVAAKRIIAQYQSDQDLLFLRKDDPVVDTSEFLQDIKSQLHRFSIADLPEDFTPTLPGEHNLKNYAAALQVAIHLGIPSTEALVAMNRFKGVEFRLQLIKEWHGIKIYNDTAATSPTKAIAALNTFHNAILIAGGMDKGLPYEELAYTIDRRAKAVYFLEGDATEKLKGLLRNQKIWRSTYADLEQLLKDVRSEAQKGDIILFSPGATSFNLFQNEFDRGRKFNAAVERVFPDE